MYPSCSTSSCFSLPGMARKGLTFAILILNKYILKKKNKLFFFLLQVVKNKYSEMKAGFEEKNKRGNQKPALLSAAKRTTKPAFFRHSAAFLWRCSVSWGRVLPLNKGPGNLSSLHADKRASPEFVLGASQGAGNGKG